jgi:hypothetical protein
MSRTVAEVIVEALEKAGAKRCYGVAGRYLQLRHRRDPAQRMALYAAKGVLAGRGEEVADLIKGAIET